MDRSVGSSWTRSVVGVRGPGVSVFGLPGSFPETAAGNYGGPYLQTQQLETILEIQHNCDQVHNLLEDILFFLTKMLA